MKIQKIGEGIMVLVRKTMEEINKIWTPERIREFSKTIPEPTAADYEEIPEATDEEWASRMSWTEFLEYEKRMKDSKSKHLERSQNAAKVQKRSEKQVKQRWFGKVAVL